MKRLLMLIVLLAIFAGGVYGAWYFFDLPVMLGLKEPPVIEEELPPPPEVYYTTLGQMTIPIFRGRRVHNEVQMVVSLGVHFEEADEFLKAQKTRLHDLVLREMTSYINLQFDESNAMNVADVKKRIEIVSNAYLGRLAFAELDRQKEEQRKKQQEQQSSEDNTENTEEEVIETEAQKAMKRAEERERRKIVKVVTVDQLFLAK